MDSDIFDADDTILEESEDEEDIDGDIDPDIDLELADIDDDGLEVADIDEVNVEKPNWKTRLSKKIIPTGKKSSWEDKYEDEPLKSVGTTTVELEKPVDRFQKTFVAFSFLSSKHNMHEFMDADSLLVPPSSASCFPASDRKKRSDAWEHHMQWSRRNILADYDSPSHTPPPAVVQQSLTLLSRDSIAPIGQLLTFRSNSSDAVVALLDKEPLSRHGAIKRWEVLDLQVDAGGHWDSDQQLLQQRLRSHPFLSVGYFPPSTTPDRREALLQGSLLHELNECQKEESVPGGEGRVALFGRLVDPATGSLLGVLKMFSAKTAKAAATYAAADPSLSEMTTKWVAPINLQDVSGMHHLMARSFGELTELDNIHGEDPEDLLLRELHLLESCPEHRSDNLQVVNQLVQDQVSYRYHRLNLKERYDRYRPPPPPLEDPSPSPSEDGTSIEEVADNFNKQMNHFQKVVHKIASSTAENQ